MNSDELKKTLVHCPFCGSDGSGDSFGIASCKVRKADTDDNEEFSEFFTVTCHKCWAGGPYGETREEATHLWNRTCYPEPHTEH